MDCFVSMACCVDWKATGFRGNEDDDEEVDKEDDEDEEEEEEDEEDVAEDVVETDSESLSSEGSDSLVTFCFKDGNTVGARTDRPGISNVALVDLLRFRWRVIFDSHTTICVSRSYEIKSQEITQRKKNWPMSVSTSSSRVKDDNLTQIRSPSLTTLNGLSFKSSKSSNSRTRSLPLIWRAFKA